MSVICLSALGGVARTATACRRAFDLARRFFLLVTDSLRVRNPSCARELLYLSEAAIHSPLALG